MRINSLNSFPISHPLHCSSKRNINDPSRPIMLPLNSFGPHSVSFCGWSLNSQVKKIFAPKAFRSLKSELYRIELLQKVNGKPVEAYLSYGMADFNYGAVPESERLLRIYDKKGVMLGGVNINFDGWKSKSDCEAHRQLSEPYLRLHNLLSIQNNSYAGIGSTLIQACVEKSLPSESKGRIFVNAINLENEKNDPFVFYKKMGLAMKKLIGLSDNDYLKIFIDKASRKTGMEKQEFLQELKSDGRLACFNDIAMSLDDKLFELYKVIAEQKKSSLDQIYLSFNEWMYLHDDAVQKFWLPKIEANPIFSKQNRVK